jgi:hypothetical protein
VLKTQNWAGLARLDKKLTLKEPDGNIAESTQVDSGHKLL